MSRLLFAGRKNVVQNVTQFYPANYGVVSGTGDNATALLDMRNDLLLVNGAVQVNFTEAEVRSTNVRWACGVRDIRIVGKAGGTILKSANLGGSTTLGLPLFVGDILTNDAMAFAGTNSYEPGVLFNTVTAGASAITLTTAADHSHFSVGSPIFLFGYEQLMFGYPPCQRFFERNIVTAINTGTGVLTLQTPLSYSYNSLWHDVPNMLGAGNNSGKPRVVNLDRSGYTYPDYIKLENLIFASGINADSGTMLAPCLVLEVVNCTVVDYVWPSENGTATYTDCVFRFTDLDKLCNNVTFLRCTFTNGVLGATAINNLTFDNCDVTGPIRVCPRHLTIKNCRLTQNSDFGSIALYPSENPIQSLTLQNNTFNKAWAGTSPHLLYLTTIRSLVVDSMTGSSIRIPWVDWTDSDINNHAKRLMPGTRMRKSDASKSLTVTDLTYTGTHYIVATNATGGNIPVAGETWQYRVVQGFTNIDGHTILDGQPFADFGAATSATFSDF